jgi:ligand-binding sensor domain-containing protein
LKKYLLTCYCFFTFPLLHLLHAQNFRYTQYTTANDLPSDNVYCAAQDNHGFMYFGTDFGLVRYDGFRFIHYSTKEGLINKPITDMVYAGGDSIIFTSYPDALQTIHADGRIDTIINKTNIGFSIEQITRQGNHFYIYKRNAPVYAILEGGKVTSFSLDTIIGIPNVSINSITSFNNDMAFCTSKGLFIIGKNNTIHLLKGENIFRALLSSSGQLIVIGEKSIYHISNSLNITISPAKLPHGFNTLHMQEDKNGGIWFRGLDKGVYRLSDNVLTDMAPKLQLTNQAVNEFYKDNSGNFWVCSSGTGIYFIPATQAAVYSTQEGLVSNKVQRLFTQEDKLWIGTQNGLSLKQGNKLSDVPLPKLNGGLQYIHKLFEAAPGVTGICITNIKGYDADSNKTGNLIRNITINSMACRLYNCWFAWPENDSIAWIQKSRSDPIIRINTSNNQRTYYNVNKLGIRKIFDAVYFNNSYWFGTDRGIVKLISNSLQLIDSINSERIRQVTNLLIDSKNQLWVATEVGLFKLANNKFITLPKAASYGGNYCTGLTEDNKGNIWAATWDGIFSTDGQKNIYYNNSSGLSSRIVNSILFNKTENTLYAGTDNGLTVFSKPPGAIDFTQSVFISASLSSNGNELLADNAVLLPTQNDLSFYLSIPLYINHEDVFYEYSLDNKTWVQQKTPILNFENLAGGKHLLKVRARINSLNLSGKETAFHFRIKIPFYKKWWFIVAALVLLQLLIISIINNINKKRKQKQLEQQLLHHHQMLEQASLKQQAFTALLNPHFIFNALNSVQHFINQQDRQNANRYLSDFASLIRRNFDASQQAFIPLEAEQESLRLYLELEKMRFGDKINYTITNAEGLDTDNWMLPTMMLQPFLEKCHTAWAYACCTKWRTAYTLCRAKQTTYYYYCR